MFKARVHGELPGGIRETMFFTISLTIASSITPPERICQAEFYGRNLTTDHTNGTDKSRPETSQKVHVQKG
jgi:hypothetical protein